MDERILTFIKNLKLHLEGIPDAEAREAVSYYEEYLNDAAEAGKDIDEILLQFDSPEKIAAEIKAEACITRAQRSPGLKNFSKILKYAFNGITTPLAFLGVAIFVIISYSLVISLFAGAAGVIAGAVGAILLAIYEATSIPSQFTLEILGTIGIGLLSAGICLFASLGLYKLGRLLIIASAKMIHRLQKSSSVQAQEKNSPSYTKKGNSKPLAIIYTIIIVIGFTLFFTSGLPYKYFTIFNSMKPQSIVLRNMEYSTEKINKISIVTAHSHIKLEHGSSDKVNISYEQPDWLDYECSVSGSMLSFYEKSNGRLSLFWLIKRHESVTEITIAIPEGYNPDIITLESTGGYILIKDIPDNLKVTTNTGSIKLDNSTAVKKSYSIKASTGTGYIEVNGAPAGSKYGKGLQYYDNSESGKSIILESKGGNISIIGKQ